MNPPNQSAGFFCMCGANGLMCTFWFYFALGGRSLGIILHFAAAAENVTKKSPGIYN
jgi:hypothetical protein